MYGETYDLIMALELGEQRRRTFDKLAVADQRAIWTALAMAHLTGTDLPFVAEEAEIYDTISRLHGNLGASRSGRALAGMGICSLRDRVGLRLIEQNREHVERLWTAAMTLVAEAVLPAEDDNDPGEWYDNCWSAARRLTEVAGYSDHNLETWVASAAELAERAVTVREAVAFERGMDEASGLGTQMQELRR